MNFLSKFCLYRYRKSLRVDQSKVRIASDKTSDKNVISIGKTVSCTYTENVWNWSLNKTRQQSEKNGNALPEIKIFLKKTRSSSFIKTRQKRQPH